MTTLAALLTEQETRTLSLPSPNQVPLETPVKDLTVAQLSAIGLHLMMTEVRQYAMPCVIGAQALSILTWRATAKGLPIF